MTITGEPSHDLIYMETLKGLESLLDTNSKF